MDQKAHVIVFVVKDGHEFQFHMPLGARWSSAYDAVVAVAQQMEAHIKQLQEEEKKKAADSEAAAELVE